MEKKATWRDAVRVWKDAYHAHYMYKHWHALSLDAKNAFVDQLINS